MVHISNMSHPSKKSTIIGTIFITLICLQDYSMGEIKDHTVKWIKFGVEIGKWATAGSQWALEGERQDKPEAELTNGEGHNPLLL